MLWDWCVPKGGLGLGLVHCGPCNCQRRVRHMEWLIGQTIFDFNGFVC